MEPTCGDCGEVYHDQTQPTAKDGVCDKCGGRNLKRRQDDNEESMRARLFNYYRDTSPLIGYYHAKNKLRTIDGLGEIEDVANRIAGALNG